MQFFIIRRICLIFGCYIHISSTIHKTKFFALLKKNSTYISEKKQIYISIIDFSHYSNNFNIISIDNILVI